MRQDSPQSAAIDAVVFDIGRVLVQLDFSRVLEFLAGHGLETTSIDRLLDQIGLVAYERGEFDGEELLRRMAGLGKRPMSVAALREHWLGMFVPASDMIDLARRLAVTHRVYLLSNIGDLHWDFLEREIGVGSIGHGAMLSFQAGACKPDPEIYRRAEERFRLEPVRTVFIDDMRPNVAAARQRGWHAIEHEAREPTLQALRWLGVPA